MTASVWVGLGLASIVVFSVILLTAALMMRRHWDDLGRRPQEPPASSPGRPPQR